jgi:hypothetical protein
LDVCATCVFIFDEEIICKGEGIRVSNCRSERDASTLVAYKVENGADSVVDARRNEGTGKTREDWSFMVIVSESFAPSAADTTEFLNTMNSGWCNRPSRVWARDGFRPVDPHEHEQPQRFS